MLVREISDFISPAPPPKCGNFKAVDYKVWGIMQKTMNHDSASIGRSLSDQIVASATRSTCCRERQSFQAQTLTMSIDFCMLPCAPV